MTRWVGTPALLALSAVVVAEQQRQVEEIVVTGAKRPATFRELPQSVHIHSGDSLVADGVLGLEQIAARTPSLTVTPGYDPDSNYASIRGVTANSSGGFFTRPTGLLYDTVSLVNPSIAGAQPDMMPFGWSSVEVLSGPQGHLFGGASLAGAVRYVPAEAQLGRNAAKAETAVSSFRESEDSGTRITAITNFALGDRVALHLGYGQHNAAGYVDDVHSQQADINTSQRSEARFGVRWSPQESLDVELRGFVRRVLMDNGRRTDNEEGRYISHRRAPDTLDSTVTLAELRSNWSSRMSVMSVSLSRLQKDSYRVFDDTALLGFEQTPLVALQLTTTATVQDAVDVYFRSPASKSNWRYLVGLYWMKSDQLLYAPTPVNGVDLITTDLTALARERALYADFEWKANDALSFTVGGRRYLQDTLGNVKLLSNGLLLSSDSGRPAESGFNPKFVTALDFSSHGYYLSATKGFRFGGVNAVVDPNTPAFFESDSLWSYELGTKGELASALTYSAAVYRIDWNNVQVDQAALGLFGYIDNVGAARVLGAELGLNWHTARVGSYSLNLSHVDARTTVPFESDAGELEAGTRLPASAHFSGAMGASKSLLVGQQLLSVSGTYSYRGRSTNNLQNSFPLPAVRELSLSVGLSFPALYSSPTLNLRVQNALNSKTVIGAINDAGSGVLVSWFNPPRRIELSLAANLW